MSHDWRATATCGDWTLAKGSYGSKEEARSAGDDIAYLLSQGMPVMDGPGCDPPFVLC